jgi:hypothetical protein
MHALSRSPVVGLVFIVFSFALWGVALASPFVMDDAPLTTRAGMGMGLYGLSYVAFGIGCKMCGQAMWPAMKRWAKQRLGLLPTGVDTPIELDGD